MQRVPVLKNIRTDNACTGVVFAKFDRAGDRPADNPATADDEDIQYELRFIRLNKAIILNHPHEVSRPGQQCMLISGLLCDKAWLLMLAEQKDIKLQAIR